MEQYLEILKRIPLFASVKEEEILAMLDCLGAKVKSFKTGQTILMTGDAISDIGIVLSGRVQIIKVNIMGYQTILTELQSSDLFAETFVCAGIAKSPVTALAAADCKVMFLGFRRIMTVCSSVCTHHTKLIENMLQLLATKNLMLKDKVELLSQRSIRDKILHYLSSCADRTHSTTFSIPFNRNELADFLCVDRSALSRELGKMQEEKIIQYDKNKFIIDRNFSY